jgi:hypothetical protein
MKCVTNIASAKFRSLLVFAFFFIPAEVFATSIVPFALSGTLPAGVDADDPSTGPVSLGIDGAGGINFLGQSFSTAYVNENGNVSFLLPLSQFTPSNFATGVGLPIIAPFFADVDLRGGGSITYGNATYNGRAAFVADWLGVGYYDSNVDKVNSFQLILTDRSDTGSGNFDIEFNYGQIQWETGDASGGRRGLAGASAAVGYSNGKSGAANAFFQLPGSLTPGAFITGGVDSLVANSLNSATPGRYDFQVRNAQTGAATPEPSSVGLFCAGMAGLAAIAGLRRHKYVNNKP